ncbi:MAG TPA: DUF2971 domain-containing protein [Spirochaetota bacterium]|nr:DUF2971 domain-containing protein [Spirochaetota bacterium]
MNVDEIKNYIYKQSKETFMEMQMGIQFPENCYHYTSISTFLKIIKSKELRLSHFNFLNDPNEVHFGLKVIKHILRESDIYDIICGEYFEDLFNLKRLKTDSIFVFSLSEDGDSLSQWMSYGDHGAGVSISFFHNRMKDFLTLPEKTKMKAFLPVNYYSDGYRGTDFYLKNDRLNNFEKNLVLIFNIIYDSIQSKMIDIEILKFIADYIVLFASCIKHSFYESEKEFRIILMTSDENNIHTEFLKDSLKIYYQADIKAVMHSMISGVIIGPKHYGDERIKFGIDIELRRNELDVIKVVPSSGIMQ